MTDRSKPSRPHVFLPAEGDPHGPPLLLLHGTGGDEHDLLPLRDYLSPGAAVLSVRGTVLENGMPRFFRRLREGVFDEDDLRHQVDELAHFVTAAGGFYGIETERWSRSGSPTGPTSRRRRSCNGPRCWRVPCCWRRWFRTPNRRPSTWPASW